MHGKVYSMAEMPSPKPPLHPFCRCKIQPLEAVVAGYVTREGTTGADYWLKNYGKLPGNYVTKKIARKNGWKAKKGNLAEVLPGSVIGGDVYHNDDGHLPSAPGRIWYEADFDYNSNFRGNCRLVYSNDGLLFASYDHYVTYLEII